ncbi:MAG TPA: hypothetical protein VL742_15380 [Casimicrobiaceae bacterium]|nr:hypothetical protein [Casimicrobiaceae bacterium]
MNPPRHALCALLARSSTLAVPANATSFSIDQSEVGNASVTQMNVQTNAFAAGFSLQSTNNGWLSTGYIAGMRSWM